VVGRPVTELWYALGVTALAIYTAAVWGKVIAVMINVSADKAHAANLAEWLAIWWKKKNPRP